MVDQTGMLLDTWEDKDIIDLVEEMTSLTLSIVCKALFNIELGEKKRSTRKCRSSGAASHRTAAQFISRILSVYRVSPDTGKSSISKSHANTRSDDFRYH